MNDYKNSLGHECRSQISTPATADCMAPPPNGVSNWVIKESKYQRVDKIHILVA